MRTHSAHKNTPTVRRTLARKQELKNSRFVDKTSLSCLAGYEARWFFGSLAILAAVKRTSRLPLALRDEEF